MKMYYPTSNLQESTRRRESKWVHIPLGPLIHWRVHRFLFGGLRVLFVFLFNTVSMLLKSNKIIIFLYDSLLFLAVLLLSCYAILHILRSPFFESKSKGLLLINNVYFFRKNVILSYYKWDGTNHYIENKNTRILYLREEIYLCLTIPFSIFNHTVNGLIYHHTTSDP